jgi:hypothetical protein
VQPEIIAENKTSPMAAFMGLTSLIVNRLILIERNPCHI